MTVDHFEGEDVIITFERNGAASVINMEGKIKKIGVAGGEQSTEVKYCFGNKQILFSKPAEKFKIDFDVVINFGARYCSQAFFGGTSVAAGQEFKSSSSQSYWRVIMWAVPSSEQKKSSTITVPPKTSSNMARLCFVDCRTVSFEREFESEGMWEGTISFEFSSTDDVGYPNFTECYTNSTTTSLATILATTHRGTLTWNTTAVSWTGAYNT